MNRLTTLFIWLCVLGVAYFGWQWLEGNFHKQQYPLGTLVRHRLTGHLGMIIDYGPISDRYEIRFVSEYGYHLMQATPGEFYVTQDKQ